MFTVKLYLMVKYTNKMYFNFYFILIFTVQSYYPHSRVLPVNGHTLDPTLITIRLSHKDPNNICGREG